MEEVEKRVRDQLRKLVLDKVIDGLLTCKQPYGCDTSCPYYKESESLDHPLAYCMAIMAGGLNYVRRTLEEDV